MEHNYLDLLKVCGIGLLCVSKYDTSFNKRLGSCREVEMLVKKSLVFGSLCIIMIGNDREEVGGVSQR